MCKLCNRNVQLTWLVLRCIGVDDSENVTKGKAICQKVRNLFFLFLVLLSSFLNSLSGNRRRESSYRSTKLMFPKIIIYIFVPWLWVSLYRSRKKIGTLRKNLNAAEAFTSSNSPKKIARLIDALTVSCFLFPLWEVSLYLNAVHNGESELRFDMLLLIISSETSNITAPVLANCIYWSFYYRCKRLICGIKEQLRRAMVSGSTDALLFQMNRYRHALVIAQQLEDCFSGTAFKIIAIQIMELFLLVGRAESSYSVFWLVFFTLCFAFTVEAANDVSQEFESVRHSLVDSLIEYSFRSDHLRDDTVIQRTKSLILKKPVVLSAGGFFYLKRGFILGMLGTFVTYGVFLYENL